MEVNFSIEYHHAVVREDIPKLSSSMRMRVKQAIEEKLMTHPELFGKPLRRSIKGFRKLRVGDYRVIFKLMGRVVRILIVQHRSAVYTMVYKRI